MATVGLGSITIKSAGTTVGTGVDTINFTNAAVSQSGSTTTVDVSNAGGFIDGAGTATKIASFSDSNTITNLTPSAAIAQASGGATVDTQARSAINTLLTQLATMGIISP